MGAADTGHFLMLFRGLFNLFENIVKRLKQRSKNVFCLHLGYLRSDILWPGFPRAPDSP